MYLIPWIPREKVEVGSLALSSAAFYSMEQFHLVVETAKTSEGRRKLDTGGFSIALKESKNYKDGHSI